MSEMSWFKKHLWCYWNSVKLHWKTLTNPICSSFVRNYLPFCCNFALALNWTEKFNSCGFSYISRSTSMNNIERTKEQKHFSIWRTRARHSTATVSQVSNFILRIEEKNATGNERKHGGRARGFLWNFFHFMFYAIDTIFLLTKYFFIRNKSFFHIFFPCYLWFFFWIYFHFVYILFSAIKPRKKIVVWLPEKYFSN